MTAQTESGGQPSPAVADDASNVGQPSPAVERRTLIDRFIPALMLIVDARPLRIPAGDDDPRIVDWITLDPLRDAILGGVSAVEWRDYSIADMYHAKYDTNLLEVFCVENTSWFSAISSKFTAIHLPERGFTTAEHTDVMSSLRERPNGDHIVISRSVHGLDAATNAERDGADMLVLGTVFPSASHPGGPTIGLEGVREVCAAVTIPVIGIGGITAQNAGDVIRAGASGVAVISAIFDAPDARAAAAELRGVIDAAWRERGNKLRN
jgi:thiamine-phosphate diphosphorylase